MLRPNYNTIAVSFFVHLQAASMDEANNNEEKRLSTEV